jgi:cation diffusion facilitator family transporter
MSEKPLAVYAAATANLVIAAAKFTAAAVTGSSAMLAEGIHSVVDTGNQVLLLVGHKRSQKSPDELHPFGYGKELYFWGLMVAVLLFGIGGGMSVYEGVHRLRVEAQSGDPSWSYIVIGVAAVAEGSSWVVAARSVRRSDGRGSFLRKLAQSKDPSKFVVIGEDSAALIGLLVALVGVFLSHRWHSKYPDAIASIVIGLVLAAVAVYLIVQSKHLLLGESADPLLVERIRNTALKAADVAEVGPPLTMHFGPQQLLVNLQVRFVPDLGAERLPLAIEELERTIRAAVPQVKWLFVELEAASTRTGRRRLVG